MAAALVGCGRAAPSCAAQETQGLVLQLSKGQVEGVTQLYDGFAALLAGSTEGGSPAPGSALALSAIRTTDFDENTGTYTCAADLEFALQGEQTKVPITYTSELVESGENDFYVTVYGL